MTAATAKKCHVRVWFGDHVIASLRVTNDTVEPVGSDFRRPEK